ncbi:MAG: PASTA domain-containing protein [Nitrospiraceae bacterium]|nr:PASTA domain-containing protein [Nitrospiraceae bacterium]
MLKKILRRFFYLFLLLLLGAGSGFLTYKLILRNKTVSVPELTGQPPEAARGLLRDLGLRLRIAGRQFDPVVPPGDIDSQDPAEGQPIKIDSAVTVTISEGPATERMPSVLGLQIGDAVALLSKDSLVASETIRVHSDRVPAGAVIAQDPEPGEKTGPVHLIASDGPLQVSYYCPDFKGMSAAQAQDLCQALGIDPVFAGSGPPAGTVKAQSPAPGSRIGPGQKVFMELQ